MRRGGEGRPGKGKHVVLIAADQEYRCEQAMPMLALILFTRLISLSLDQEKHIEDYFDSGKPIIALRTSNHGFEGKLDYKINDQQVTLSQIFGGSLPEGCRALVYGQPLIGRGQGGTDNPEKEPLPVVWFKNWKTSTGKEARVLHSTMGSSKDFENPGLRRLVINGVYWSLNMEDKINEDSSVNYVGEYKPLSHGFHHEKLGVVPHPVSYYR